MKMKLSFHGVCRCVILLVMTACLCAGMPQGVFAENKPTYKKLTVHTLTVGDQSDYRKASEQIYETDGNGLLPFTVNGSGTLYLKMYTGNPGAHSVLFFRKPDASGLPETAGCITTAVIDPMYYGETYCYLEPGTWYMHLPEDRYRITAYWYPQGNLSLKNGTWTSVYCDFSNPTYLTFKATDNGYITIKAENLVATGNFAQVTLCNSKRKEIVNTISSYLPTDQFLYAVKKNVTYKIKIGSSNSGQMEFCRIRTDFKKRTEKSGSSRKKAVTIKTGTTVQGMVFAEDSVGHEDWYKVTIPGSGTYTLTFSGSITSGTIGMDLYRSNGKKPRKVLTVSKIGDNKSCSLESGRTYYIRVTKSEKKASGIYSLKISK